MAEDLWQSYGEEEKNIQKGYKEGVKHGESAGFTEGWELGARKGYEIGVELGFYGGALRTWEKMQENGLLKNNEKIQRAMEKLQKQLDKVPMENEQDGDLQERIDVVRGTFKEIVSIMGMTKTYFPPEEDESLAF